MIVSIVIPTKNGKLFIDSCLKNIFNQKHNFKLEVTIIDSGSTDGTLKIVKKYPVRIIKIKPKEFNHGLTRNHGISVSKGKFVVLIVQDAIPFNEHWLTNLIKEFKDKKVAGVYCQQVPHNNCRPLQVIKLKKLFADRNKRKVKSIKNIRDYDKLKPMDKLELIRFDDVCSCIRKRIWEKYPYDKTDFAEDLLWSKKVILAGYKIVYTPDASVFHSHNRSIIYEYKREFISHKNVYKIIRLNTVLKIKLTNIIGPVLNTWILLWKNNYKLKYWIYYITSPFYSIVSHIAQYYGVKSAKKEIDQ